MNLNEKLKNYLTHEENDFLKVENSYNKKTSYLVGFEFASGSKDKNFEFSINLTLEDMIDLKMREFILQKLTQYNIGSRVVFEIVESEEIANFDEINDFIANLRELGCKIAIDDFGSGYSNFAYLIKLNADYIKIDGSLIKDFTTDKNHSNIVTTILEFAKLQNIKTIAEFVSKEDILEKVTKLEIDYAQGFYIHEPSSEI